MNQIVLVLANCFVNSSAQETLTHAAWQTPWALRICPAAGVAPITRARITVSTFIDPVDGWGERGGLAALLSWVVAADAKGGPIVVLRHEIEATMSSLGATG